MSRKNHNGTNGVMKLKSVAPLTENQEKAFEAFRKRNLLLHGWAGTGKTFVALYLSLREILNFGTYNKLYIVRSAVPSRSVGFLPGDLWEKLEVFEAPYADICNELVQRPDGYNHLKSRKEIEFISTSYLRGVTIDDAIILVDEIQNCDFGELSTVITRLGKNIKVVFCGDFRQTDFRGHEEPSRKDVHNFMDILKQMNGDFEIIEFGIEDIVRNPLVKAFLVLAGQMGLH